ncbi:MAG TPA: sigma factor-like helix-turn-helix DNA-binding protein, partial [Ignavibacteria bacterium]|nr:sigma factor-like helix-turn-helix DNA-binding protein [Ignavibacteria bacterium]
KERVKILYTAIDKLPENQKSAYILSKFEELSYSEISNVMKISIPAVESLLVRAKENLKKNLTNFYKKDRRFLK